MYPFGKDFQYTFQTYVDNEPVQLPTGDTPAIYIYTSEPTQSDARSGTGATGSAITSWTETDAYLRTITVPAISDPTPTATATTETYWIAINYKLQTGGQSQTVIRRLPMERARAVSTRVKSSTLTLQALFPTITTYLDDNEIRTYIDAAIAHVKAKLSNKGYEWSLIWRLDNLSLAVDYQALALFARGQRGDEFRDRYKDWKDEFTNIFSNLQTEYDSDNSGAPDTKTSLFNYAIISR